MSDWDRSSASSLVDFDLLKSEEEERNLRDLAPQLDAFQSNSRKSTAGQPSEFACQYCLLDDPGCVVKCLKCNKWFCSSRKNTKECHYMIHLVTSKHKECVLHADGPMGDCVLECYNCGVRNLFLLGYVPCISSNSVLLICREPCLYKKELKDHKDFDFARWQSLLSDKALLTWLINSPSNELLLNTLNISFNQVMQLEDVWGKGHSEVTIHNLEEFLREKEQEKLEKEIAIENEIDKVKLTYLDALQYQRTFTPLIELEAEEDKKIKEQMKMENVVIRWDLNLAKKRVAYFSFVLDSYKLNPGDELKLTLPGWNALNNGKSKTGEGNEDWEGFGLVNRIIPGTEEICLDMRHDCTMKTGPWNVNSGFKVEIVWKSITFDRCKIALNKFVNDERSVSGVLYYNLLGHDLDRITELKLVQKVTDWNVAGLPSLNNIQMYAIRKAVTSPLCLIQGPPGTGKTVTSAAIVYHMVKQFGSQVLVTASSNTAVDQLCEKLHRTGLRVVRVYAKSREGIQSSVSFLSLHEQVKQIDSKDQKELNKLLLLREQAGDLSKEDEERLIKLRYKLEVQLLDKADVICTTCSGAADFRLKNLRFKHVLLDEATQAIEPEAMIAFTKGAKQIIMVGDHCQLGPVIMSKRAAKAGLQQSMFERLVLLGLKPVRLEVQYRMHPALSEFPSLMFYDGCLQNGISVSDRKHLGGANALPWPQEDIPILFLNSSGFEEISGSGTSYLNRSEALNIEKILTMFIKNGVPGSRIGVITPYEGQRAFVTSTLQRSTNPKDFELVEIASVDSFQGREKDYIILSCVRSNQELGIGFLADPRRMNVALTRGKYGLIICGNARVLSNSKVGTGMNTDKTAAVWRSLLSHLKSKELIVEGPLSNLRPCTITIQDIDLRNVLTTSSSLPIGGSKLNRDNRKGHFNKDFSMDYYRGGSSNPLLNIKDKELGSALQSSVSASSVYFTEALKNRRRRHNSAASVSSVNSNSSMCVKSQLGDFSSFES